MGAWNERPVWLVAAALAFGCAGTGAHGTEGQRASPASFAPAPAAASITVAHYAIDIPGGYEAKDVSPPMMDFDLYRVTRQGSQDVACGLYFGNHPSFPKLHGWRQEAMETKGDDRTTTAFQRSGAIEGLIKFSGLAYKDSDHSPWSAIHYFCDGLDEAGLKVMLAMVASIKVARPHLD
jgi:hypothetical protein